MTSKSPSKIAARSLAALTGRPYQSCLGAIEVLRSIPPDFDIGELADFFTERPIDTSRASIPCSDLVEIPSLFGPRGSTWLTADDPVYLFAEEDDDDQASIAFRLSGHQLGLWSTVELWMQLPLLDARVRAGTWRIRHEELNQATRTASELLSPFGARDGHSWDRVDVRVVRTREPLFEPLGVAPDTYISDGRTDALRHLHPTETAEGPGFDWLSFPFKSLGLWEEDDHRLTDCDGYCGQLHDWPTEDPRRTDLVIPGPLLVAWRALSDHVDWPLSNELNSYRRDQTTFDDVEVSWYGLDLPTHGTLWLGAEVHDPALAAPPVPR